MAAFRLFDSSHSARFASPAIPVWSQHGGRGRSTSQGARLAIAVSEDVDMYDMDDIMWNLTTRVNPHTDILNPLPGGRGQTFMPAERMTAGGKEWTASNTVFEGGMGIDATVPFGFESDFLRPQYPVDKVNPSDFFSKGEISMMDCCIQRPVIATLSKVDSTVRLWNYESGVCELVTTYERY